MTDTEAPEGAVMVAQVPKYQLTEPAFISPWYLKADTIIEFDGEPGPHMRPLNAAAEKMMEAYFKTKPDARITPVEDLQITPGANPRPTFAVVGQAQPEEIQSFVDMAHDAGYSTDHARVVSLGEAQPGVRVG